MEYEEVQRILEGIGGQEGWCLGVYAKVAFERDVSDVEIGTALDYFRARGHVVKGSGSRSEKIILLDNLIAVAHKRGVDFSPAGQAILDTLAGIDPKLQQVYYRES